MKKKKGKSVVVGITCGDLNGIGMEVIIKALSDPRLLDNITPVIYATSKVVSYHRKATEIKEFNFLTVQNADEVKPKKINLVHCWEEQVNIEFGAFSPEVASFALKSLEVATNDLASNKIDVLVTAPIDKKAIQSSGFEFPGHTEYFAKIANVEQALMLMVHENLRVAVVTGHIPLKHVPEQLSKEKIIDAIRLLEKTLVKDFKITKPRIAVLGLNPHAGEKGLLGNEEAEIISPAIQKVRDEGVLVFGPYAADGFFGSSNFANFDGILAMYHDQGLIPFKALSFGYGVNYTAGLPVVRTSPDHGTAFEIAGKDQASPSSFLHAVFLARDIFLNRKLHKKITADVLEKQDADH